MRGNSLHSLLGMLTNGFAFCFAKRGGKEESDMRKTVKVHMKDGLEARPVAMLVQTANRFSSHIYLELEEKRINAKSIMGVMSLALMDGSEVTVDAEGADEKEASEAVGSFLTGQN